MGFCRVKMYNFVQYLARNYWHCFIHITYVSIVIRTFVIARVSGAPTIHSTLCTNSHLFIYSHPNYSFPLCTLLTPITPLCWQWAFHMQATEKAALPPKCWHAQMHPLHHQPFHCTPWVTHCLYCSPCPISLLLCSTHHLWVSFLCLLVPGLCCVKPLTASIWWSRKWLEARHSTAKATVPWKYPVISQTHTQKKLLIPVCKLIWDPAVYEDATLPCTT